MAEPDAIGWLRGPLPGRTFGADRYPWPDGSGPCGATAVKAVGLVEQAAAAGAAVVVFPAAYLGTYPKGLTFGSPVGRRTEAGRREYQR